ncbi:hypothetical protein [Flavobacterium poyangense]|uniref:hypothetical protein n=1 Tax=Flavobacterium poyangense TaxID=2204302 RepID=UPI0014203443|nr:hypothetical protein [Flavobacterium sp. JXAS1]
MVLFKLFKIVSVVAIISSVVSVFVFVIDLLLAGYRGKLLIFNLIFIAISLMLVWFWMTLSLEIKAVYLMHRERNMSMEHWSSIFKCLGLLAASYIAITVICYLGLIDRMLDGTALLG